MPPIPLTEGELEVLRILAGLEAGERIGPAPLDQAVGIFSWGGAAAGLTTADLRDEDGRRRSHSFPSVPYVVLATLVPDGIDLPGALRVLVKAGYAVEERVSEVKFGWFTTPDGRVVSVFVTPEADGWVPAVYVDGKLVSVDRGLRVEPTGEKHADGFDLYGRPGNVKHFGMTPAGLAITRIADGIAARQVAEAERLGDAAAGAAVSQAEANAELDDGMLGCSRLAARFGVRAGALRKRLQRWRTPENARDGAWLEVAEPGPRQPRFLYHVPSVQPLIEDLRRRTQRPASVRRKTGCPIKP